ncbi:MAG: hypothetical protein QOD44_3082, partial [Solirubrobacteraceae bacterium]|nr:hypothetical protein [Solirubrobacteraceae bacterium]
MTAARALRIVQMTGAAEGADWFAPMCAGLATRGHEVLAIVDARPGDLAGRLAQAGVATARVDLSLHRPLSSGRGAGGVAVDAVRLSRAAGRVARLLRSARAD